jgi:hypothetical protein
MITTPAGFDPALDILLDDDAIAHVFVRRLPGPVQ